MARGQKTEAETTSLDELGRWMWETTTLALENMRTTFRVEIQVPVDAEQFSGVSSSRRFEPAVQEIRAFRAEILYAAGRRPFFRSANGGFADSEEADTHAYHITCRDKSGGLLGCLRLARPDLLRSSAVEAHLGPKRAARLVRELGIDRTRLLEAGRLVVAADQRRQGVAAAILLTALVLGRWTGRPVIWATAGERDGQNSYFTRFGSSVLPGSSRYVPVYDDTVCVVTHDQRLLVPLIQQCIGMAELAVRGADDQF